MRKRKDSVPSYRRGSEPVSHPIWNARVGRLLKRFGPGEGIHVDELVAWGLSEWGWGENLAKNVVAAAEDRKRVWHDGTAWRACV
jgi:hypothetical protein